MKKKVFLFAILAVTVAAALVILHSCEGLFNTDNGYGVSNGQFLYTDYDTDILLVGKTDNGDDVTILGTKDSQGYPTSVTGFEFKQKGSKNEGTVTFEGNKIVKSEIGNGVTILFDYLKNGEVAVTMVDTETGEEFKTSITPDGKAASGFSSQQPGMRSGNTTLTVEEYAVPEEAAVVPDIATKGASTKAKGDVKGIIHVEKCGYPDDEAKPYVVIYKENIFGKYDVPVGKYYATRVGKGEYEYTFPGSDQPHHEVSLGKFVKNIADFMGKVCTAQSTVASTGSSDWIALVFCPSVAGILGSGIVTAGAAAAFLAACEATVAGLTIYCNTLGQSAPGGDDPAGQLADKFAETKIGGKLIVNWDEPIAIVPYLEGLPNLMGKVFMYKSGSTAQTSTFSSEEPTIAFFRLTPSAPSSGQSYDAEAGLKCIPAGTKVTISITGTDGYSDSKTETFEEDRQAVGLKLHVPGAAKGVRDVCEVNVEMPGNRKLYKSAALVFGE